MANALPWSVRGIDPDIREQAVEAAHRAGMSVGQWLTQVLAGNLDEEGEEIAPAVRPSGKRRTGRLDDLNERISRLGQPRMQTAAHRFIGQDNDNAPVLDLLESTIQAIERLESRTQAPDPVREPAARQNALADQLRNIEQRINALGTTAPARKSSPYAASPAASGPRSLADEDPAFAYAIAEVEARRRNLDTESRPAASAHVAESGPRGASPLDSMREQLDQLVGRIDAMRADLRPDHSPLQARIDELTNRIEQWRKEPASETRTLQARLDELSARIEQWQREPRSETRSLQVQIDDLASRIEQWRHEPRPEARTLQNRLDELSNRIEKWQREPRNEIAAFQGHFDQLADRIETLRSEPRPEARKLQSRIEELTNRIVEMRETRPQDDVGALRSEMAQLAASIERLSPQHLVGMVEEAMASVTEKAFRAYRDGMPERLVEPIERVHEDVRSVLRELISSRGNDRLTQEVSNISRRLDLLAQSTDTARIGDIARETETIKALVGQALNTQPLEGLARQIEMLGQQLDKVKPGAQVNDRSVLDAIRDVTDRLERIDPALTFAGIEKRLEAISSIETKLATITGLEDKINEIASGMKKLAKDRQPLPQLDTIAERLERIDRVLDKSGSETPLAGLSSLAERLDQIGSSLDRVASQKQDDQSGTLIGMLEQLSQRIEKAQASQGDSPAFDALQDEIARLAKRMDQVGGTPVGLDGIERTVSDLFHHLDETRRDMREMAEVAASKAAQEALRNAPREESNDTLAAEGLLLIKRDLNEFKTAQSEAEKRTRSTLEALHGTLETLVGRLGDIETRHQAPPAAAPVMQAAAPAPARQAAPQTTQQAPAQAAPRPAAAPVMMDDALADLPLEPGMLPGQSANKADTGSATDPRSNFLAAARRAAQTAADRSQSVLEDAPAPQKKAGKPGKPAKPVADAKSGAASSFIARARRPILLGLAAIVFSLGALKVLSTRNAAIDAEAPAISKPSEGDVTGSVKEKPTPAENQLVPKNSIAIPPITPPASMQGQSGDAAAKRGQRLSDTSAISQTDPLTVGSISPDGTARPIETGKGAISDLITATNLKTPDRLRDAALEGNAAALFEIGSRLADGRAGMPRDPKLAMRWFELAAAQGHGPSQYRLASLYREGKGIPKDSSMAFQWFDRAAAQGHVLAMHNAAVLLAEGVHGAPDYAGAALWFKRAAEYGIKDSQFNVAILFARGLGVNQDLGESYRWFAIAALQGDQDAAKKRDDIAARLSKEQLAKEVERVKAFKPNKANPAANEPGAWEKVASKGT